MGKPFLPLSFYFDLNKVQPPSPITAQCEVLPITWGRGSAVAPAPDPIAPYWFVIYTSLYQVPIILPAGDGLTSNLTIPFPPNTQYQVCMYDSVGNTGGCQDIYTVYPSPTGATCSNFTLPDPLGIKTPTSRTGWVPQCDTITMSLDEGQPPFKFTAQPALHPPMNVSGITGRTYEWKNILGWTVPFFISLSDANGRTWSWGPLHSGDGPSYCLDYDPSSKVSFSSAGAVAGLAIGMVVAGMALALAAVFAIYKYRVHKYGKMTYAEPVAFYTEDQAETPGLQAHTVPATTQPRSKNIRSSAGYMPTAPYTPSGDDDNMREVGSDTGNSTSGAGANNQNVYVVHHDGGRAPVTIFTADGSQVVELPPTYRDDGPSSSSRPLPAVDESRGRSLSPGQPANEKRALSDHSLPPGSPGSSGGHFGLPLPQAPGPSEGNVSPPINPSSQGGSSRADTSSHQPRRLPALPPGAGLGRGPGQY